MVKNNYKDKITIKYKDEQGNLFDKPLKPIYFVEGKEFTNMKDAELYARFGDNIPPKSFVSEKNDDIFILGLYASSDMIYYSSTDYNVKFELENNQWVLKEIYYKSCGGYELPLHNSYEVKGTTLKEFFDADYYLEEQHIYTK
jgi:hypothetical protein